MLTEKEAKEIPTLGMYTENNFGGRVLPDVNYWYCIDKIYESRGTCSTCTEIGELGIFCRHWYMKTEPDGYCHHFKKGDPR